MLGTNVNFLWNCHIRKQRFYFRKCCALLWVCFLQKLTFYKHFKQKGLRFFANVGREALIFEQT